MGIIGNVIYWPISSKEKVEEYQVIIRNNEWNAISRYINKKSSFLDIGCGAGYAMMRAKNDLNCEVSGIDPNPGSHGVGRFVKNLVSKVEITKGIAENLPYSEGKFQIVYSSHVLEHVNDEKRTLAEINRVLKMDGIAVIGMPTSTMAILNLISQVLFTTHIKIYEFIRSLFKPNFFRKFIKIFSVKSHSYPRARSIWYDINHYRISKWKKLIETELIVQETIKPVLYPYPDYPQFFKLHKNLFFSSSVFFICKKKN
jgi:ubiquinone/menaquinone biosynthesis C-methylase UbiE